MRSLLYNKDIYEFLGQHMSRPLEKAANAYHLRGKRVPSAELANLFRYNIWPYLQGEVWSKINQRHFHTIVPDITFQAPYGLRKRQYPLEVIFDSHRISLAELTDLLAAAMNLTRDTAWTLPNGDTIYGIYDQNAILSIGDPDKISGVSRFIHTSLLADQLSFVNPPLCASTATYVAPNILGSILQENDPQIATFSIAMENLRLEEIGAGRWNPEVVIDGFEPRNFIRTGSVLINIDPVINQGQ